MRIVLLVLLTTLLAMPLIALPRIAYIGMSAALPGSAELALGKPTRGGIMIAADLLSWLAWSGYKDEALDLEDSFKRYAQAYAGVPSNSNDRYYQHIQQYYSSDEFNSFQEMMARNFYLIYNYDPEGFSEYLAANLYADEEGWQWQSPEHHQKFRDLRKQRQKAKMYQNLALGALLLNRGISIVDALFLSGKKSVAELPVYFSVSPERALILNYRFEF
ncbi:MAG: hypothetical protein KBA79_04735 [Candidatus Cloacimonetes bacterium]|nr:hypothetical protein [Candidatus Cloacimonadota bacterium]